MTMMKPRVYIVACILLLSSPSLVESRLYAPSSEDGRILEEEMVDVVVRYNDDGTALKQRLTENTRNRIRVQFTRTKAVSLSVPRSELSQIEHDPSVKSIHHDHRMYPLSEEIPWGIETIQGTSLSIPLPSEHHECFKVCIVDSGLSVAHEDIPYTLDDTAEKAGILGSPKVMGEEFGIPDGQHWYDPAATSDHGTHVTGTVIASGGNGFGVVGVVPNSRGICMMHARVFPDDQSAGQLTSYIDAGVEWCADNGARVINLSLGSPFDDDSTRELYERVVEEDDVLLIAASGNSGGSSYSYPAAYDFVMGVAGVNEDFTKADFSQYNDQVDICAPGDSIVSTVPGMELVDEDMNEYSISLMDFSVSPTSSVVGELFFCGLAKEGECAGASGKVCFIQRGNITFAEKAIECETAGGIAAFVYNNNEDEDDDAIFSGTLQGQVVDIPIYAMSKADGEALLNQIRVGKKRVELDLDHGTYTEKSGTSMASPHVAGVAAKIWAALPQCTSSQVREALEQSALDLHGTINRDDDLGRDDSFGYGLVQAVDAYNYLLELCGSV